ncbi:hypothetical protein QYM36_012257 [Artemia franciscana]|uniref:Uncharacterized protein n=1 Tax=Artemia franciscana TaxID=6661 RepID=A0AA88HFD4_ARTSF|nr:hypothetical protein QYM36_012257 [Artemia franciscana]
MPTKVALKAVVDSYDLTKTNKGLMTHDDICSEKELLSQEQQELEELEQTQLDTRREASTLTPESPNAFEEISSESRDKFFDANKDAKFKIINPPLRHIQKELLPQHLQFLNYEYQAISVEKQFSSHTRTPLQVRK